MKLKLKLTMEHLLSVQRSSNSTVSAGHQNFYCDQNKMSEVDPNDPLEGFLEHEDIHDFTSSFDDPLISSYETTDITTSQDDANEGNYSYTPFLPGLLPPHF